MLGLIDERDLVMFPDLALDSLIAARVMSRGMAEGLFTEAKLGDFFNEDDDDPIGARTIINGHDKDELIASYHDVFLEALNQAQGRERAA
jgi:putative chitinase